MILLFILLACVIGFLVTCLSAWVATLIAPMTGIPGIEHLDFWNWFWIVLLVSTVTSMSQGINFSSKS